MMLNLKNGQVTLFVILGIVILIIAVLILNITNTYSSKTLQDSTTEVFDFKDEVGSFESYLQTASDEALFRGIVVWGSSGGKNLETTSDPTKTYIIGDETNKFAYLYKDGVDFFDKDGADDELQSIVLSFFFSNIDIEVFYDRDFEFYFEVPPELELSINENSVSNVLNPNIMLEKYDNDHVVKKFRSEVEINLTAILDEVENIILVLKNITFSDLPYNFSKYNSLSPQIQVCGFEEPDPDPDPNNRAYLVKIIDSNRFRSYPTYTFEFLTDIPLADNECST